MFSYDPRKIDFQCFHYLFSFFQFCTLDALAPGLLQINLILYREPDEDGAVPKGVRKQDGTELFGKETI